MRSVVVSKPGGPEALEVRDMVSPQPGAGEVLVRTVAAAVNPVDVATRDGVFHRLGWINRPATGIGWDISGYIAAVGEGVTGFAIGDPVAGLLDRLDVSVGAYSDALVLPAAAVARLPDGLGFVEAATLPLNSLTADQAIDQLGLPVGASLLVTGAAGGVGGFAVALASRRGLEVTALARASDAAFVEAAGASHHVVDLEGSSRRFDGVLDAAVLVDLALGVVRDGGRYVGVLSADVPASQRNIVTQAVRVKADGARLGELLQLAADGVLVPRIAGLLPLDEAPRAHRQFESGGQRGRWVLVA